MDSFEKQDKEPEKKEVSSIRGRVTLVGAGPGDAGLITVKGLKAIREADCIIYDRLVSPELLKEAKPDCEKIYVGKENHHHSLPQEEINGLMARKARQYRNVVRLKGGDGYVFGRGGEEGIYLKEQGVDCFVIPGISSAIAGPACAGIPVTHRGVASGFRVVTAHDQRDQLAEIDFSSMQNPRETLIFLMGLDKAGEVAQGLLKAGRAAATPAAVISHAATKEQRLVMGNLETIAEKTKAAGLTSPAIIVVGEVVALGMQQALPAFETESVLEGKPFSSEKLLSSKRYLVPVIASFEMEDQKNITPKSSLAQMLRKSGAQAEEVVVGQIRPCFCELSKERLSQADWLVFSSGNGVTGFFENLRKAGLDGRSLAGSRIAVIGKKTEEVLAGYGIRADFVSEKQHGEAFAEELAEMIPDGATVFYPSAVKNSGSIEKAFKESCNLVILPVYENKEVPFSCEKKDYDGIFVTCASSAERFFQAYTLDQTIPKVYSIGPKTTERLKKLGIRDVAEAREPSYEALAALLEEEIVLVTPMMDYGEEIMQFRREFLDHDPKEDMGGTGNLRECETAQEWVDYVRAMHQKETCPVGLVTSDIFMGVRASDRKIVGMIEFRHHIDHPILGLWGGHIGYCVRPDERRKGYGKQMLGQVLIKCRQAGLERVMLTCDEGNIASERTILAKGGVYEKTVWSEQLLANMKRFWISL